MIFQSHDKLDRGLGQRNSIAKIYRNKTARIDNTAGTNKTVQINIPATNMDFLLQIPKINKY